MRISDWSSDVCSSDLIISALLATYMAAALAGSLMPANMGWVEPGQGVRIFVYSNGVHTGIVVPTANKVKDWRSLVRPNDLSDPRYAEEDRKSTRLNSSH